MDLNLGSELELRFVQLLQGQAVPLSDRLVHLLGQLEIEYQVLSLSDHIQLASPLDLIDVKTVRESLDPSVAYEHHWTIGSTSKVLTDRALMIETRVCTAEMQTAGRGRRGRQWQSPFGQNLCISWLGSIARPVSELGGLSIAVGIHWAEKLRAMGFQRVGLKWPNDLMMPEGKLGGILIELEAIPGFGTRVCVGMGMNIYVAPRLSESVQPTSCLGTGIGVTRTQFVIEATTAIGKAVETFGDEAMRAHQARWSDFDCYDSAQIGVIQGDQVMDGLNLGIHQDGGLKVKTDAGEQIFYAGEVSVRATRK